MKELKNAAVIALVLFVALYLYDTFKSKLPKINEG